ncbi:MAG TPA: hypothetical protein VFK43_06470, partial [Acidimicrobiales bacterium]|nr:hypothetical protein [Acidimicrobiales bacterium]
MEPQSVFPPPPAPAPRPPRWGLGDFLVGVFGGYALASRIAAIWYAVSGDDELSLAGQAVSQMGLWTGMVGASVVASHRKGAGTLAEDFGLRGKWSDIGFGLVVALAVQLLVLPGIA